MAHLIYQTQPSPAFKLHLQVLFPLVQLFWQTLLHQTSEGLCLPTLMGFCTSGALAVISVAFPVLCQQVLQQLHATPLCCHFSSNKTLPVPVDSWTVALTSSVARVWWTALPSNMERFFQKFAHI
jgi:hypothetical protein